MRGDSGFIARSPPSVPGLGPTPPGPIVFWSGANHAPHAPRDAGERGTTVSTTTERMAALETLVGTLAESVNALVSAQVATSRPRKAAAKNKPRTFATKAEREAGNGFSCSCGRNDLRTAVHAGSFHKAPDGSIHTVE